MSTLRLLQEQTPPDALNQQDDAALMLLVATGQTDAFAVLVARHEPALGRFLSRMVGVAEADDLCQESFVELWRRRTEYQELGKFRPLLYRIARNKALSHLRWRAVRLRHARQRLVADADAATERHSDTGLDRVLRQERDAALTREVLRLPYKQREAVVLHYAESFDFASMAAITGVAEGTLRVRAHRGLARLREAFAARGGLP
jgi:RNA polymerase sigma-70 factor (ECF subfamily)